MGIEGQAKVRSIFNVRVRSRVPAGFSRRRESSSSAPSTSGNPRGRRGRTFAPLRATSTSEPTNRNIDNLRPAREHPEALLYVRCKIVGLSSADLGSGVTRDVPCLAGSRSYLDKLLSVKSP